MEDMFYHNRKGGVKRSKISLVIGIAEDGKLHSKFIIGHQSHHRIGVQDPSYSEHHLVFVMRAYRGEEDT